MIVPLEIRQFHETQCDCREGRAQKMFSGCGLPQVNDYACGFQSRSKRLYIFHFEAEMTRFISFSVRIKNAFEIHLATLFHPGLKLAFICYGRFN